MFSAKFIITFFLIIIFRLVDVTLATIRTILLTKGMTLIAAIIGFFEIIVYIQVLGNVVNQLDNVWYIIAYAIGFSAGNYLGGMVEKKLAFGSAQMRIITGEDEMGLIDTLRNKGYGVTVFNGEGRDGKKIMLFLTLRRKNVDKVHQILKDHNVQSFVSVHDISSLQGGYNLGSYRRFSPKKRR